MPIASSAPEELTTISFLMALPPAPFVPAELVGTMSLAVMFVWAGEPEAGQAAIQPFREVATPLIDMVMPMPYPGIYQLLAEAEKRSLERPPVAISSTALDDDAIDAILDAMASSELAAGDDPAAGSGRGDGPGARPTRRHSPIGRRR